MAAGYRAGWLAWCLAGWLTQEAEWEKSGHHEGGHSDALHASSLDPGVAPHPSIRSSADWSAGASGVFEGAWRFGNRIYRSQLPPLPLPLPPVQGPQRRSATVLVQALNEAACALPGFVPTDQRLRCDPYLPRQQH